VNHPDGRELMTLADKGGEATIYADLTEGWFKQRIPVATIPGTRDAADFVLAHGHYDSWDVGVGDNATGDATLLELARTLWQSRGELGRSVKLAWWPGHSTGRYAGSTWFTDRFAIELDEHCVAQINCDSPGCRWATSYHDTRAFTESAALAADAIRDILPEADIKLKRPPQAGDYSFNNIGLPSLFMLSSTMPETLRHEKNYYDVSGCGANIAWHTENDTIEIADRNILLTDMRIYLLAVLRIANAELLPFDWIATCDEFLVTIAQYEDASQGIADLSAARTATIALKDALGRLQRSGVSTAQRNGVIKQLSRLLVPINFTREPRFRHDPAYTVPPLPTLAVAAELLAMPQDLRRFGEVELMRGQNRYVAALRAASALVEGAMR
jgi:N-acetylated-alpha-linked acidic dipeptidase